MGERIASNNIFQSAKILKDFDNDGTINDIHAGVTDKINPDYLGEGLYNKNEVGPSGKITTYLTLKEATSTQFGGVKLSNDFILDSHGKIRINLGSQSLFSGAGGKANLDGDGNVVTQNAIYFQSTNTTLKLNAVTGDITFQFNNRNYKIITDRNINTLNIDAKQLNGKTADYYRCSNGCSWTCSSTCTGGCGDQCTGLCSASCTGSCLNGCITSCTGSCQTGCDASCTSSCQGSCQGSCIGSCTSCTGCSGTCTGSCTNSCSTTCLGACLATCVAACRESCILTCSDNCFSSCASACRDDCSGGCLGA